MIDTDHIERAQIILDKRAKRTSYEAFCEVLNDMAEYAASKGWDFIEEAGTSAFAAYRPRSS